MLLLLLGGCLLGPVSHVLKLHWREVFRSPFPASSVGPTFVNTSVHIKTSQSTHPPLSLVAFKKVRCKLRDLRNVHWDVQRQKMGNIYCHLICSIKWRVVYPLVQIFPLYRTKFPLQNFPQSSFESVLIYFKDYISWFVD